MFAALGSLSTDLAIDLGSHCTRVYRRGVGLIYDEASLLAIYTNPQGAAHPVAQGNSAASYAGRTPTDVCLHRPIVAEQLLNTEAGRLHLRNVLSHAQTQGTSGSVAVTIASNLTALSRRTLRELFHEAGARRVLLVPKHVAFREGARLLAHEDRAQLLIDVGLSHTALCLFKGPTLLHRHTLPVGGRSFDQAIQQHLRAEHQLEIGQPTAEHLKQQLGCAWRPARRPRSRIWGRCLQSGRPRSTDIQPVALHLSLRAAIQTLADGVAASLHTVHPRVVDEIIERGAILVGGGARLKRLPTALSQLVGLPFVRPDRADHTLINGLARLIEHPAQLQAIAC